MKRGSLERYSKGIMVLYKEGRITPEDCAEKLEEVVLEKDFSLLDSLAKLYGDFKKSKIGIEKYCDLLYELAKSRIE